jgi:AbrB family looped-hinge helix DNA binding protein
LAALVVCGRRNQAGITIRIAVIPEGGGMETTLTSKGQVTIPKHIREALSLEPGCKLVFDVNQAGELVLRKDGHVLPRRPDRFDLVAGTADVELGMSTDEYMELIRGYSDDPA